MAVRSRPPVLELEEVADDHAPAARVPTRVTTHWRDGVLLACAGAVVFGAAPLAGVEQLAWPVMIASLILALIVVVRGVRTKARHDLEDRTLEALAPVIGLREVDRRAVRMRRWTSGWPGLPSDRTGGWPGRPRTVRLRYAPGADDGDPRWTGTIVAILNQRMLATYRVARHDPQRCIVDLRLNLGASEETDDSPRALVRADQALTTLIGPTAKVENWSLDDDGELSSVTISHQAAAKLAAGGYRTRIERTISAIMPGRWRAIWDLEHDLARFEVRPTLPSSVWLPTEVPDNVEDLLENYEDVRIPYGIDEDGEELYWEPARVPQFLVTGGTGTGKTSTTHGLVGKITQYGWPVWILDGKRVEFLHHRTWPNVQVVATTVEQQVALVHRVYMLVKERYRLIEEEGVRKEDFEPLVVILDEWAEFLSELNTWYGDVKQYGPKGQPTKPPTIKEFASLARLARTARVHLLPTMQRPDVALLGDGGGEARSNFGQRASIGRLDPQGAQMMWDSPAIGTTIPRGLRQRMITTNADGVPVEAQAYRFPSMTAPDDSEEGRLREALRPTETKHKRLLILPPEERGEDQPLGFWDYAETEWVLAEDRPDLDPVVRGERRSNGDARHLSSAMKLLGLAGAGEASGDRRPALEYRIPTEDDVTEVSVEPGPVDEYAGYNEPIQVRASELSVGDLIQVEDGSDEWVVVDEPPLEDPVAPGMVAVSWRSDTDEYGAVSLPDDGYVATRQPEEFAA